MVVWRPERAAPGGVSSSQGRFCPGLGAGTGRLDRGWSRPGQPCLLPRPPALSPRALPTRVGGCPHRGRPGGPSQRPPPAWKKQQGLRLHTLRAVCSLFAEVLWPVFWFSYVLESHKLKTGHFPDLTQVTCHFFFRVCHVAVLF